MKYLVIRINDLKSKTVEDAIRDAILENGYPTSIGDEIFGERQILEEIDRSMEKGVIEHLNQVTGSKFKAVESNYKPIRARLDEGFTVEECKKVIDHQASVWMNTDMQKYLRVETLFRPSKFQGYLSEALRNMKKVAPKLSEDMEDQELALERLKDKGVV